MEIDDRNINEESEGSEDETESDCDLCDDKEIETIFNAKHKLLTETKIKGGKYILHIDGTLEEEPIIALGNSGSTVDIYSIHSNQLTKIDSLHSENEELLNVGVKFIPFNRNLLFIAYNKGIIKLWDLRDLKKPSAVFKDTTSTNEDYKKFECFDVSCNGCLLAVGTETFELDAFIFFWDIRNTKLLGGYWESHQSDITQIKFHAEDRDKMMSSSTDGLINIYDLKENTEDKALQDSLNSESSVEQIGWFKKGKKDAIYCSTHTFDVQLWDLDDAEPFAQFERAVLANKIKRKCESHAYVAGMHLNSKEELMLLIGSNYKDGDCVRGLTVKKNELHHSYNFKENKQRIRGNWFNKNTNLLVTGGEKGLLDIWSLKD